MNTQEHTPIVRTNRDIYQFVMALRNDDAHASRTLVDYLRALWLLSREHRDCAALPPHTFAGLLRDAFVSPTGQAPEPAEVATEGYDAFERRILWQIRDLVEMEADGSLENEMRYFGISSPRGSRWYNFDPGTFLECGAAGSFGGWEPGDDSGRDFVPGPIIPA